MERIEARNRHVETQPIIFDNSAKKIQWRKDSFFFFYNKQLDIHILKKENLSLSLISYVKINSKWIVDLNIKYKTIPFFNKT